MANTGRKSNKERLLSALPLDGTFRTNREVRNELHLSDERYWEIRDKLLNEGLVVRSRGNGGRIARTIDTKNIDVKPDNAAIAQEIKKTAEDIKEEYSLYEPFRHSIEIRAKDEGAENTVVEITARQGRRQTNGEWSRPDICQISVRNLRYLGQKVVEVTTFELKMSDCDVSAVFEALSHSRRAHRSYLAIHLPNKSESIESRIERIRVECARSGVGLILFGSPSDLSSFQTVVEPKSNWVDLSEVDEFISTQISGKEKIRDWL